LAEQDQNAVGVRHRFVAPVVRESGEIDHLWQITNLEYQAFSAAYSIRAQGGPPPVQAAGSLSRRQQVIIEPAWVHLDKFTASAGAIAVRPGVGFEMAQAGSIIE
jgi:hypothetical protein